jgi:chromosome segregation ATPase
VSYLTPAPREIARQLKRQLIRLRAWQRSRALGRAEAELGLLGWQQAEFDPETERQVSAIQNVEKEQARLINAAAERSGEVRRLHAEYGVALREHLEARRALEAEKRRVREPRGEIERTLAEKRKTEPNFERRIPELDRELREVSKLYASLMSAETHTPKLRQELIRVRERVVAIPNEKSDLRTEHLRTVSDIRALEESLARVAESEAKIGAEIHALDAVWSEREKEIAAMMKGEEREKAKLEKQIALLESSKSNPYQRIGQVLAACNLAPVNQPEALDRVKDLEQQLARLLEDIEASLAETVGEDAARLRASYAIWAGIAVVVAVVAFVAMR